MSESGSIIEITSAAIKLAKKTMHYRIATRGIVFLDPISQYEVLISVYYPNSQMSIGAEFLLWFRAKAELSSLIVIFGALLPILMP